VQTFEKILILKIKIRKVHNSFEPNEDEEKYAEMNNVI